MRNNNDGGIGKIQTGILTLALLVAGSGGGMIGANMHMHPEIAENERRIDKVETRDAVLKAEQDHLLALLAELKKLNLEAHAAILLAIIEHDGRG